MQVYNKNELLWQKEVEYVQFEAEKAHQER